MSKKDLALPLGALALIVLITTGGIPAAMADGGPDHFLSPLAPMPEILNSEREFRESEWIFLGHSIATYYGDGEDGFLGRRHGSSWHGETPAGFSETVTACCEPGIALSTTWGVRHGREVLVVWEEKHRAVKAVRVDTKPGMGVDLYEWLYLMLSPQDIGPLRISLYTRRSIWETSGWKLVLSEGARHAPAKTPLTDSTLEKLQEEPKWRRFRFPDHGER